MYHILEYSVLMIRYNVSYIRILCINDLDTTQLQYLS